MSFFLFITRHSYFLTFETQTDLIVEGSGWFSIPHLTFPVQMFRLDKLYVDRHTEITSQNDSGR